MVKPNVYLFPQLSDNYGYFIKNPHATEGVLIDPSDYDMCLKIIELNDSVASHILITHHHEDHVAAVDKIKKKFDSIVIGYSQDDQIPKPDQTIDEGQIFEVHGQKYEVIHTPGHTLQHINYFMKDHNILFSGDTLFNAGCGRMFEGDPKIFWKSLLKIKSLPLDTKIYCGHEYTLSNIKFALSIDPDNQNLLKLAEWVNQQEDEHRPTIPTTLEQQILCNPFLRCDTDYFFNYYNSKNPEDIFAKMRSAKDNF